MKELALAGVKVVDLSTAYTGPLITTFLSSNGAEVIKVESSHKPDIARVSSPFKDGIVHPDRGGLMLVRNPSKYSITLDLNHPRSKAVMERLIRWADILVEGFAVGVMERWALDYKSLSRLNPSIIMFSTSAQGQDGPYSRHPGWGVSLKSLCGFTHLTGWPDREGVPPTVTYTNMITPLLGAAALIAALDHKRRTGQGQFIDQSQLESSLYFLLPAILDYTFNQRVQSRQGNSLTRACPHGCYRCRGEDRWFAIAIFTDEEWQSFSATIGKEWANDPRFSTFMGRKANETELERLIEEWTIRHTPEEITDILSSVAIACGAVEDEEDVVERDPQLSYRDFFPEVNHPVMGSVKAQGIPFRFQKLALNIKAAPCLGQHTEYICTHLLEMSDEEFVDLLQSGVFT